MPGTRTAGSFYELYPILLYWYNVQQYFVNVVGYSRRIMIITRRAGLWAREKPNPTLHHTQHTAS